MRHLAPRAWSMLLIITLLFAATAVAQAPPAIAQGLAAIKAGNTDSAIDAWTKTWAAGAQTDSARLRLKTAMANITASGNAPQGWELVRDMPLGKSVHRYYVVLQGARDPIYLVLEAYQRPDSTWTVEHIQFNATLTGLPGLDAVQFLRVQ